MVQEDLAGVQLVEQIGVVTYVIRKSGIEGLELKAGFVDLIDDGGQPMEVDRPVDEIEVGVA